MIESYCKRSPVLEKMGIDGGVTAQHQCLRKETNKNKQIFNNHTHLYPNVVEFAIDEEIFLHYHINHQDFLFERILLNNLVFYFELVE